MLALKPLDFSGSLVEIFGYAGQSNMSGRGLQSELPPAFAYGNRVKLFTNAWTWADGYEPTDDETGQIDTVSIDTQTNKASSGMSFGSTLAGLRVPNTIGIVPCAKGATGLIADWQRNLSRSTLYGSMVARLKAARAFGAVKGIVWYQGEHEANSERTDLANSYAADWLAWAQDVCDDMDDQDLKFIVTELGPNPGGFDNWSTVQAQQRSLDGARGGNVACVSAADLTGKPGDEIHIDTASLIVLGQRYAAAMNGLLGQ
jgi:hypothetical protein